MWAKREDKPNTKMWRLDHFWKKEWHSSAVEQSKQKLSHISVLLKYVFLLLSIWNDGCNLVNVNDLL